MTDHRPRQALAGTGASSGAAEAQDLSVAGALAEIWSRLGGGPKVGDAAEIHRGVEWAPGAGLKRGLAAPAGGFLSFLPPGSSHLSKVKEEHTDLPWGRPKVVVSAVDVSRRPWSIAAFGDEDGLVVSRDFICLWPRTGWSVNSLAAVLNGPVVSAFVATREPTMHLRPGTLKEAPLPRLGALDSDTLDRLVAELVGLFEEGRQLDRAREVLLRIDAQVLRGYNLQPRLERKLLDFFRGRPRPVPFTFGDYFPPDFTPNFPLWMYISGDLARCTAAHLLRHAPEITDPVILAALEELG